MLLTTMHSATMKAKVAGENGLGRNLPGDLRNAGYWRFKK